MKFTRTVASVEKSKQHNFCTIRYFFVRHDRPFLHFIATVFAYDGTSEVNLEEKMLRLEYSNVLHFAKLSILLSFFFRRMHWTMARRLHGEMFLGHFYRKALV